jgi:dTDP-4-amino-4,6-dideoxy-D-galactose acyltransferase
MKLQELVWDSTHYGIKMARLDFSELKSWEQLDADEFDFIRARVISSDIYLLKYLQDIGFRIFDTLVRLDLRLSDLNGKSIPMRSTFCRWYDEKDIPEMRRIAASSFTYDHHHQDKRFKKEKVDEMHSLWVDKCIRDGYEIDVAEKDEQVAGFMTTTKKDGSCYIELIAVDEKFRGQGIAESLLRFSLTRAAFDVERATVETQLANVAAIRLYEKVGFKVAESFYTLHRWAK